VVELWKMFQVHLAHGGSRTVFDSSRQRSEISVLEVGQRLESYFEVESRPVEPPRGRQRARAN
jgi:hypothetical protein